MTDTWNMCLTARLRWKSTIEQRAHQWIVSRDTGMSSQALWSHMMGVTPRTKEYAHPWDPDDLGRCLRLLKLIPEWHRRIPEMAVHSTAWKRLAAHWDKIAQSMEDEVGIDCSKGRSASKTYDLMRKVLKDGRA